jgi:mannose-6-phosphate isomerase-like protein (cupin superfamily)
LGRIVEENNGFNMEIVNINDIENFQDSRVIKKIPLISNQLMSTILFIGNNTTTPNHKHLVFDEIHYIIQGAGKMTIDGKSQPVTEGMMILVPKSKPHSFSTLKKQMTVLSVNLVPNFKK